MPRGEMEHTKIIREIKRATPAAIAMERAKRKLELEEHSQPFNQKKFVASLTAHVGKLVDRTTADDVIKVVAWLGLAYLIKPVLDSSDEVAGRINYVRAVRKLNAPLGTTGTGMFFTSWIEVIDAAFGGKVPPEQVEKIKEDVQKEGIEHWALALSTSALIIVFGPSLLEGFGGMVSKLAIGLLT